MGDEQKKPSAIADDDLDQAQGAGLIIQRVEDADVASFHGSNFNFSDGDGIAAMGNSGHVRGAGNNSVSKK